MNDSLVLAKESYDFKVALTFTWMKKWSSEKTLYLSGGVSHFKINNVMTKELKSYHYQDFVEQLGDKLALKDDREVYVGNYFQENTQSFKAEAIYFFFRDAIGVSGSFSRTLGKYNGDNWKLGIPFSLKDKEQKPAINFELQWKETYGKHIVGISVGYNFGKFID